MNTPDYQRWQQLGLGATVADFFEDSFDGATSPRNADPVGGGFAGSSDTPARCLPDNYVFNFSDRGWIRFAAAHPAPLRLCAGTQQPNLYWNRPVPAP